MMGDRPTVRDLVIAAARICRQDPFEVLYSKRRDRHLTRVRHYAAWIAHREHGYSLNMIGRRLSRDHSSVLYGIRVVDALIADDELVIEVLGRIDAEAWKRHQQGGDVQAVRQAA
jgi:hypothetical protein